MMEFTILHDCFRAALLRYSPQEFLFRASNHNELCEIPTPDEADENDRNRQIKHDCLQANDFDFLNGERYCSLVRVLKNVAIVRELLCCIVADFIGKVKGK
jgi:hypothetical protein